MVSVLRFETLAPHQGLTNVLRFGTIVPHQGLAHRFAFGVTANSHLFAIDWRYINAGLRRVNHLNT